MKENRRYRFRRIAETLPILAISFALLFRAGLARGADGTRELRPEERGRFENGLRDLGTKLDVLRRGDDQRAVASPSRLADAEVFGKGLEWALKYDTEFTENDIKLMSQALDRFRSRVGALQAGSSPWTTKHGKVVRGFVSAVDGSRQPYGLIVPARYDANKPIRLDVVLHGSSRPVGMSELRFMARFDELDNDSSKALDVDYIELHPLGRVENGYRWAGETDVFEAIEAVSRGYAIDRDRIVLRGMSMGASGTWHLGLKHPDQFVALGPYCGYVDTHEFSNTPLPNFVKVGPLPPHQESMLHLLDSVDYAANAGIVPAIACMGEKDIFFQAHEIMKRAMTQEGLAMVNLISPGTGHVQDPDTHKEQMRRIGGYAEKGLGHVPERIHFVTWTLKYDRSHWIELLGLEKHYARTEMNAQLENNGTIVSAQPKNITRFALLAPVASTVRTVRVGGEAVAIPPLSAGKTREGIVIGKQDGKWSYLGPLDAVTPKLTGKRPGLQGPIDDAFTTPFLCVRGTGTPWNSTANEWAKASLQRFSNEWHHYFRGDLPVKNDTEVTEEDTRQFNLILFGDPGSNAWIARVLPKLPIRWTREECAIGDTKVSSATHAPIMIQPNPFAKGRYVVLNSGHTFHEKELSTLNYLLFPRLGDWAIAKVPADPSRSDSSAESIVADGFFAEDWSTPTR